MTYYGGSGNYGAIYQYNIASETLTKVQDFDPNTEGKGPEGCLIETSPGTLYGLARGGGTDNQGTLFEYIISTNTITLKHDFDNNTSGREPTGDLILVNGKLYGMTSMGGNNGAGYGTIFEYVLSSGDLNILHTFTTDVNGRKPFGSLVYFDSLLFGMTNDGGSEGFHDRGVLFAYDLSTSTYTKKVDFNDTLGQKPVYNSLIKILVHADWTGAVSSDWHNPANWLQNDVPSAFTEVNIPNVNETSGNYPVVGSNVHVRDLTLQPGAQVFVEDGVHLEVGLQQE